MNERVCQNVVSEVYQTTFIELLTFLASCMGIKEQLAVNNDIQFMLDPYVHLKQLWPRSI